MNINIILFEGFLLLSCASAEKTLMMRFQMNRIGVNFSTEEWVEYKTKVPHLSAFTNCQWVRLRFFSVEETTLWSYCYKRSSEPSDHYCTQLWFNRDAASGGRYVRVAGGFGDSSYGGKIHS